MEFKEYRKLEAESYLLNTIHWPRPTLTREIDYWAECIRRAGEPALELGSGTGRVYVPLLERGFDIVGIDTSEHMMGRCRASCEAKGLKPHLYDQSMLDFDLGREFGLIFLPSGSLSLFTDDKDIHAMFDRVSRHLRPGGTFIYEFSRAFANEKHEDNDKWFGDWANYPNDVVIAWRQRHKYDTVTHIWHDLKIFEKFVEGRLVETEADEQFGRRFTIEEAVQYAETAGLQDIRVTNWLTEDPPAADSWYISVECKKPR